MRLYHVPLGLAAFHQIVKAATILDTMVNRSGMAQVGARVMFNRARKDPLESLQIAVIVMATDTSERLHGNAHTGRNVAWLDARLGQEESAPIVLPVIFKDITAPHNGMHRPMHGQHVSLQRVAWVLLEVHQIAHSVMPRGTMDIRFGKVMNGALVLLVTTQFITMIMVRGHIPPMILQRHWFVMMDIVVVVQLHV